MRINGGLVVNFKNICAESKRSGAEKKVGTCSSCVVVGTARPFDLLCSGVTGLWQMVNLVQAEAEAGRARTVSARA